MNQPLKLHARSFSALRDFLHQESAGGIVLMGVAALALLVANSPLAPVYFEALQAEWLGLGLLLWINDALMAVFFLLVGLEIKRELLDGQLSTWSRRALPGLAALGGMVVPALIYASLNKGDPESLRGWAIPCATDIAFALGVLALLGHRVPASLKVMLTAVAILDDLGAVLIIALFYTSAISPMMLACAAAVMAFLVLINRLGVVRLTPYLLAGLVLWFFVLRSGVHATVAGVLLAFAIPLRRSPAATEDVHLPFHRLEKNLHPWVMFLIVPIFGFANAGVSFSGVTKDILVGPLPLGIALGLFLGKQVGICAFAGLALRLRWAAFPAGASPLQCYGAALLCGIGFTMSLFIGALAFPQHPLLIDAMKIGIIAGSLASGLAGFAILRISSRYSPPPCGEGPGAGVWASGLRRD